MVAPSSGRLGVVDRAVDQPTPGLWRGPGSLLVWLLALYPLWWVLGLQALIFPMLAVPMAISLTRRRHVELPPAFGIWLCFCLVVAASLLMLDVNPPGTVAGGWLGRLPGALYRFGGYISVTIIALYAVNLSEREFPRRRLIGLLSYLGLVTVVGGLLGTFAGTFEFTSPVEAVLPHGIRSNGFVKSLVHPQASQVMDFLGYETPRPAAPWGYTNTWGNIMAICAGWIAVAAFCFRTSTRHRVAAVALLAIAVVPIVHSMNRGLWLNLGVIAVVVAVRMFIVGRLWMIGVLVGAGLVALLAIAVTPLGDVVSARIDNGHSDDGRGYSTEQALAAVPHSPVLGFGSTRNTVGSADSIAIGPTEACPNCGSRTLGGNGQLWQVVFAHGLAGVACYLGFFLAVLWRFRRDHSPVGIVGWVVMVLSLTSMFYYNALLPPLVLTMLCYVLLWRNERDGAVEGMAP